MISRIIALLVALIVLPDVWFYRRHLGRRPLRRLWRTLFWIPAVALVCYALALSAVDHFAPREINYLFLFLFLLGLLVVPKAIYALCSALGSLWRRLFHKRHNWGNAIGLLLAILSVVGIIYGSTTGVMQLKVRQVEYASADLPEAFDGYRIVEFSDVHAGTLIDFRDPLIDKMVDSINAQKADLVVFVGDLQNMWPEELDRVQGRLSRIGAKDGVMAVLGNHDYAKYVKVNAATRELNELQTQTRIRSMGWQLLMNENRKIRRGRDSIVVAGTEDVCGAIYEKGYPVRCDVPKAVEGIDKRSFLLMLQHAPIVWPDSILPQSHAQLTLAGHTHGGQVRLFGLSPYLFVSKYDAGMFYEGDRAMFVSSGVSGVVPFRLGVPPEIVVITLRKKR